MMIVFVIGFALLCQMLSIAFTNRWIAWAMAYLFLFLILVLPWLSGVMADNGNPWITVNLAYLNPFFALAEMTEGSGTGFSAWAGQHLVMGGVPMWLATTIIWIIVGSVSFIATLPFVARRAMTSKVIPYEDMVVSV